MQNDDLLLLFHGTMISHDPGDLHPERPHRLIAVREMLEKHPIPSARWIEPAPAPTALIKTAHDGDYVDYVGSLSGQYEQLDPDTSLSPLSVEAAYLAVGAAVDATEWVCRHDSTERCIEPSAAVTDKKRRAFALVRPPGHHAEPDRARGFCIFNNIAIAAQHACDMLGCERVLIVDWDVHHGNGTQHCFESRSDILYFSTHQYPFFPGTGALDEIGIEEGRHYTINVPLTSWMGDSELIAIFQELLLPIAAAYKPDLVLVSAGFDAHRMDPIGSMGVSSEGFAGLCAIVRQIADETASGRLMLLLEGGYDLGGLSRSIRSCAEVLAGASPPPLPAHSSKADEIIQKVQKIHGKHWKF